MKKTTRILIVGDGEYSVYEEALCNAFQQLGFSECHLFAWKYYFKTNFKFIFLKEAEKVFNKISNKFSIGKPVAQLNRELLDYCREQTPDLVFIYRGRHICANTIKQLKQLNCCVFSYNNDNPFSNYYPRYFWRHYKKAIPFCDLNYVYRESNIQDCINCGSKRTEILRSYYIKSRNFPILPENKLNDIPEVVFLGHYENDERKDYLEALADNGITIGLPYSWKDRICGRNIIFLEKTGEMYNEMLNSTKIALVFLSTLNKDTYTRRCFEIPATRTIMLSVYTDDLASMFEPDKEAVYFSSKEEFVEKVKYYLENEEERKKIGQAGYERLMQEGHEVGDRVKQVIDAYQRYLNNGGM